MPVTVPAGWTEQQDIDGYVSRWGESDDYLRDTRARFDNNLSYLQTVMDAAIEYFVDKRESQHVIPLSTAMLRDMVQMPLACFHHPPNGITCSGSTQS